MKPTGFGDGLVWASVGLAIFFATDWTGVSASLDTVCGVRSDGSAWCWGNGFNGVLGNGGNVATVDLATLVRQ